MNGNILKFFVFVFILVFSSGLVSADTFLDLDNAINGNTDLEVFLYDNYTYDATTDDVFSGGVVISRSDFVLDGNGCTISGDNLARIFYITGSNVTIKNLNLINGKNINGGGIYATGNTLTIMNSNFNSNSARNGGAIHTSGNITIIDSNFTNNSVNDNQTIYSGYGGAILANNSNVINSNFNNNSANGIFASSRFGGAIHVKNNVNIINSNFTSNFGLYGGAIYAENGNVTIINSIFNNNLIGYGGAIYAENGNVTIINSIFNNNSAWNGGAIYAENGNVAVTNSSFTNNSAAFNGGAIYAGSGNVAVTNSSFTGNYVIILNSFFGESGNGGAIYAGSGNVTIINSTFINNFATDNGGAIRADGNGFVVGSFFSNNSANNGNSIYGDFAFTNFNVNITDNVFLDDNTIYIFTDYGGSFVGDFSRNWWGDNEGPENKITTSGNNINIILNNFYVIDLINISSCPVFGHEFIFKYIFTLNNSDYSDSLLLPLFNMTLNYNGEIINVTDARINTTQIVILTNLTNNISVISNNKIITDLIFQAGIDETILTINALDNVVIGDQFNITIKLTNSLNTSIENQLINITINGVDYSNYTNNEGLINILYTPNTTGPINITVKYNGNPTYNQSENNKIINVNKKEIILDIPVEINITTNTTLDLIIPNNTNGNFTLIINGTIINGTINHDILSFDLSNILPGNYSTNIIFTGDDTYNTFNTPFNLTINKGDVLLNAENITIYFRNGTNYTVTLLDTKGNTIKNQTISITVNGVTYNIKTDENGVATLPINLNPRNYTITTLFNGNDRFNNKTITSNLIVLTTIISNDLTKHFKNDSQYNVKILDGKGQVINNTIVSFNVNGVIYNITTNDEGIATLPINLNPGNYTITATWNTLSVSNQIKVLPTLIGKDLNKTFNEEAFYEVQVLDNTGNPLPGENVIVNIHGVFYNITSKTDGIAKLIITLNPGHYIATATWNGYSTSNLINVKPE